MQYTQACGRDNRLEKPGLVIGRWVAIPAMVPSSSALSSRIVISMGVLDPGATVKGECSKSRPPMVAAATYPREEYKRNQYVPGATFSRTRESSFALLGGRRR